MIDKPIYVTSPLLPSLEDFTFLLKEIWESKMLTNNGNFHQKLEEELAKYLKVPYLSLFTNGTLPLITALQAMRITGEVITTPFSFVATTHSLWWNGIKPVFVDIEPETCNLDPSKIEAAITPRTTAIMPVHVYGKPCKTKEIQEIANKYGLKVIYDAAHAFGVEINGESILNFGDMATLSFHATKVYNTLEGGALVVHDEQTKKRIDYLKNFGFASETEVVAPGINSKVDEVRAAYGLLNLKQVDHAINSRRKVAIRYRDELQGVKGITFFNDIFFGNDDQIFFLDLIEIYSVIETSRLCHIICKHLAECNFFTGKNNFYIILFCGTKINHFFETLRCDQSGTLNDQAATLQFCNCTCKFTTVDYFCLYFCLCRRCTEAKVIIALCKIFSDFGRTKSM